MLQESKVKLNFSTISFDSLGLKTYLLIIFKQHLTLK